MSFQIIRPKQPAYIKTQLWGVSIVGSNLNELDNTNALTKKTLLVEAKNKRHAKRLLKQETKRVAKACFNALGRPVTCTPAFCKMEEW